jgi:acyl dehydratase
MGYKMENIKRGEMAQGALTDEMIEQMRKRAGTRMRIGAAINNEVATASAIRRFADGIGDSNPLWRDEEYARKTRYGGIVAPPSWVHSVYSGVQSGWRGLGGFHAGSEEEFYKPIRINDRITPEATYLGFDGPMASKFAERTVKDYHEMRYYNQKGELVAKTIGWIFRYERRKAHEKGKHQRIQVPHPWTEEELARIEEEELAEEIRGATPRYWEDVAVDEEMKPLVQGPLGLTDMIAYIAGGAIPLKFQAHGVALREYRRHPAFAFRDPETNALEPIFAVHYNKAAANLQGLPYCYDLGVQRQCWLVRYFTNWIGDDGWLKKVRAEYRSFVYLSDVIRFTGKVTRKYTDENGENCLDLETRVTNQRGEIVMPGNATVVLPSRETGISPLDHRL